MRALHLLQISALFEEYIWLADNGNISYLPWDIEKTFSVRYVPWTQSVTGLLFCASASHLSVTCPLFSACSFICIQSATLRPWAPRSVQPARCSVLLLSPVRRSQHSPHSKPLRNRPVPASYQNTPNPSRMLNTPSEQKEVLGEILRSWLLAECLINTQSLKKKDLYSLEKQSFIKLTSLSVL